MNIVVVLPTYNEKENVLVLIPQLLDVFLKIKRHHCSILVVDDSSPDGTAPVVKRLQKKYNNIFLISGRKEGLGVAYVRGFRYAMEKLHADIFVMMDADLSHPASLIPSLVAALDHGRDLAIGCRYIPGGATPDWNWKRKLISRCGNFFARVVAGLYSVHDCTSGFRAIRVSVFKKIHTSELHSKGYAFVITLLYELLHAHASLQEIPLVFYDRKYGETKLKAHDMIAFFFNTFRLRWKTIITQIKN